MNFLEFSQYSREFFPYFRFSSIFPNITIFSLFSSAPNSKCQRACEKLDLDASVDKPASRWFWPSRKTNAPDASPPDPYNDVTRTKRKYSSSESSTDGDKIDKPFGVMKESSDESEEEDESNRIVEITDVEEVDEEEEEEEDEFEVTDKITMITNYLRTNYCYCHWCGVRYTDAEDLSSNCPGETKDDH